MPPRSSIAIDPTVEVRAMAMAEAMDVRENLLRHGIVIVAVLVMAVMTKVPAYLAWGAFYVAIELSYVLHARWCLRRTKVSKLRYFGLLAHYGLTASYFSVLPISLILFPNTELQFAGLTIIAGLGLHALMHHAKLRHVLIIDGLVVTFVAQAFAFRWGMSAETWEAALVMFAASTGIATYFALSLYEAHVATIEVAAKESQLRHSQKLEAVGQLTGGIAHDFNNLLTVIKGNLELHDEIESPAERAQLRYEARGAAERGADLVRRLLAASRRSSLTLSPVDMNHFMANCLAMVRRLIPANISLNIANLLPDGTTVDTDQAQLEACVLNLINNARDAMAVTGGDLSIRMEFDTLSSNFTGDIKAGKYLIISVSDTGEGIAPDLISRVTDPYVTTKDEGKGTGLGLAMVAGFAAQAGGTFDLISEIGTGTTARLYLPA